MNRFFKLIIACIAFSTSVNLLAGPRTGYLAVKEMRTIDSGDIYITLPIKFCESTIFRISRFATGKNEMYTIIAASILNSGKVSIELESCSGWGTNIRSVYIKS